MPYNNSLKKESLILSLAILFIIPIINIFFIPKVKNCVIENLDITNNTNFASLMPRVFSCIDLGLILISGLLLFIALLLVIIECKNRFVSVNLIITSDKKSLIALGLILLSFLSFYLQPGDVLVGDARPFAAASVVTGKATISSLVPYWTFDWYMGSPHFQYYGVPFFLLTGIPSLLIGPSLAIKLTLIILHVLGGLTVYHLIRKISGKIPIAFAGALIYSFSFEHIGKIIIIGRLTNSLIYLAIPLLLLFAENYIFKNKSALKGSLLVGLMFSLIFLTSPGDAPVLFILLGLYLLLRAYQSDFATNLKYLIISGLAFFLTSMFWLIPFFIEKQYVNGGQRISDILSLEFRPDLLAELFVFPGNIGFSSYYFIGLVVLLLGILGAIKSNNKAAVASFIAFSFALIVTLVSQNRHSPLLVVFLALPAAFGFEVLYRNKSKILLVGAIILVAIELSPGLIQSGYVDFTYEKNILKNIPEGDGRILDLVSNRRTFYPSTAYLYSDKPIIFGPLLEGAPISTQYAAAISQQAAIEYYDEGSDFSSLSLNGFYLLDARYILLHDDQIGIDPVKTFESKNSVLGLERNLRILEVEASPVLLSSQIKRFDTVTTLDQEENYVQKYKYDRRTIDLVTTKGIISEMNIDRSTDTSNLILVRDVQDIEKKGEPKLIFVSLTKSTPINQIIAITTSSDSFARLAYSWNPYLTISVNGKEVEFMRSAMNFAVIELPQGENIIKISGGVSRIRQILFIISLIVLLAIIVYLVKSGKSK